MQQIENPYRHIGLNHPSLANVPLPSVDWNAPMSLLAKCPAANVTPLVSAPKLAEILGVAEIHIKDERKRMGLGSFKALGAAYVIACDAQKGLAKGRTYITASAGNHGLSVAAGAQAFGAKAIIFLSQTVPATFATRLTNLGAEVIRLGADYEASMKAAADMADQGGGILLSDSSWHGYVERPYRLMEGYGAMMGEIFDQMSDAPTHVFLQAGVGGLAGAAAACIRAHWSDSPRITVVEPDAAPALKASIEAAAPVVAPGPVSCMGRLDCKEPSLIALKGLARDADVFATITEQEAMQGAGMLVAHSLPSTPSGAAGLSAALCRCDPTMDRGSKVLLILSEEAQS